MIAGLWDEPDAAVRAQALQKATCCRGSDFRYTDRFSELYARCLLLNGYRLRQIARLIHITATAHRNVVSQQLQRDDLQNRRQFFRGRRDI